MMMKQAGATDHDESRSLITATGALAGRRVPASYGSATTDVDPNASSARRHDDDDDDMSRTIHNDEETLLLSLLDDNNTKNDNIPQDDNMVISDDDDQILLTDMIQAQAVSASWSRFPVRQSLLLLQEQYQNHYSHKEPSEPIIDCSTSASAASGKRCASFSSTLPSSPSSFWSSITRRRRRSSRFSTTSVVRTSGQEPNDNPQQQQDHNEEMSISQPLAVAMVMNYVGGGYLLLPYGFAQSGPVLGLIVLTLVCTAAFGTAYFVVQTCRRVDILTQMLIQKQQRRRSSLLSRHSNNNNQNDTTNHDNNNSNKDHHHHEEHHLVPMHGKYKLSFLTRFFLGPRACYFFTFTTSMDLFAISWTYASVFAQALAHQFPILTNRVADNGDVNLISVWLGWTDYKLYSLLFMAIAIPMSCTYLLDQLLFQMTFLALRCCMVAAMIVTILATLWNPTQQAFQDQPQGWDPPPTLVHWSGLLTVIQLAVFSTSFQFSVPSISASTTTQQPTNQTKSTTQKQTNKDNPKPAASSTFLYAVLIMFASNALLSLTMAMYFGPNHVNPSSNLNWNTYHDGKSFIGHYIVFFAAFDGLAVYPLLTSSLADILLHAYYSQRDCTDQEIHQKEQQWCNRLPFCLAASIPPALAAMFVSDLPLLASLGVIFTLLSYTACPSLLYLASGQRIHAVIDHHRRRLAASTAGRKNASIRQKHQRHIDDTDGSTKSVDSNRNRYYYDNHPSNKREHWCRLLFRLQHVRSLDMVALMFVATVVVIIVTILVSFVKEKEEELQ